jgi:ABC-2 type transport system ATP-binding protein
VRSVEREGEQIIVIGTGELANTVILTLAAAGVTATDLHLDSANLEDAFVAMTGRHLHEDQIGRVHR